MERFHVVLVNGLREIYSDKVSVMIKFITENGKITSFPANHIITPVDGVMGGYPCTRDPYSSMAFVAGGEIPQYLEVEEEPCSFVLNTEFLIDLLEGAIATEQISNGYSSEDARDNSVMEFYRRAWEIKTPDGDTRIFSSSSIDEITISSGCPHILKRVGEYGVCLLMNYQNGIEAYAGAIVKYNTYEADDIIRVTHFQGQKNRDPNPDDFLDSLDNDQWEVHFGYDTLEEAEKILQRLAKNYNDTMWCSENNICVNDVDDDYWDFAFGLGYYDPATEEPDNADDWGDGNEDDWDDGPADGVDPTLTITPEN